MAKKKPPKKPAVVDIDKLRREMEARRKGLLPTPRRMAISA